MSADVHKGSIYIIDLHEHVAYKPAEQLTVNQRHGSTFQKALIADRKSKGISCKQNMSLSGCN